MEVSSLEFEERILIAQKVMEKICAETAARDVLENGFGWKTAAPRHSCKCVVGMISRKCGTLQS